MKTEELDYTVENIQMIFNYLTKCSETHSERAYRIEVDGLEIVPCTTSLDRFNDFLFYSSPESQRITFTIYHRQRIENCYVFMLTKAGDESENARLKRENNVLNEKVRTLKRIVSRREREKIIERPGDVKVIDAGDCLVVFMKKAAIDKVLSDQLTQTRAGLTTLEKVQSYFQRHILKKH